MNIYSKISDNELLTLFKQGDSHAYDEIYYRYWAILFRHARKMLQDSEEAKDLIQDVFSAFWISGQEVVLKTTLSAYLYGILRYKIFDLIDKEKVKVNYLASLNSLNPTNNNYTDYLIREKQLVGIIEKEVSALPEKMRIIFELSRNSNMSYKAISQKLNISDHTVKKQISNALRILRTKVGSIGALFF